MSFSFQVLELTGQLKQCFNESLTGYWQIQLAATNQSSSLKPWYLAVVQGRVVFSGTQQLSWTSFVETLQRYIFKLRNSQSKQKLALLQQDLSEGETALLSKILLEMEKMNLLSHNEALQALRLKILSDLDTYLFDYPGQAQFTLDHRLVASTPIRGFELNGLLLDATKRRAQWNQLQSYVPSLDSILMLKPEAVEGSDLTTVKRQQLQRLIQQGRTLNAIAYDMGADPLEAAKAFSRLIQQGLVTVIKSGADEARADSQLPEIFIVDDSPVLVKQFHNLVVNWGYRVSYSNNALTAVQTMLESNPEVIFLDINMPGASGFELIKQIRRQPKLSSIPLVLLTAEKAASNQWRAQWASCKFLAKPSKPEEIPSFRTELHTMLTEIAPKKSLV